MGKKETIKREKRNKLRSQFLFKKGGYSIAIIALVIAALVLFNWLVLTLGDRFHLEFDMSGEKVNSISKENIDFIEKVKDNLTVTVCADEDTYPAYMASYAQNYYGVSGGDDYYNQTIDLVNKYNSYNKKIAVRFIDPQSSQFTAISQKYPSSEISYGDIIVSCEKNGQERYKKLGFSDIYEMQSDDTYAAYGYSVSNISGNNIETALTGAISYCISSKTSKVLILTGHSANDYSSSYLELLTANNIVTDVVKTNIITNIPNEYDAVVIMAPTSDFLDSELDAISAFLENGGKLSKSLIYFADSTCPSLPNLESLLSQWGIVVENGLLFETNANNAMPDDPMTMGMYPAENGDESFDNSILSDITLCITGYNVPMTIRTPADELIKVNAVINTLDSAVIAPVGASADFSGYSDSDKHEYQSVIEAKKSDYDSNNNAITSYVYAFGSIEYVQSDWAENSRVSNKNLVLACSERAVGADKGGVSFISKTITNESYSDAVTESGLRVIRIIFIGLLPIITIAIGVYVYIKRRNA